MNGNNQRKSKKRERVDQIADSNTEERSRKSDDTAFNALQGRNVLIEDMSDFVTKDSALLSLRAAEKLLHEMCEEQSDMPSADLACHRMSFLNIIVATENEECLDRFVQLGGLHVLDGWLQEAHKGRTGGEEAKASDELILMLLQALEKLRVDLDALKACPVGKSVNNLRTHSNMEVQKKARKLVEAWKKRVDAEIKFSGEAKIGTNKYDTLRSQSQPVKPHVITSSKDISNSRKLKRTGSNGQVVSASLGEKEVVDVAQDDVSSHQKLISRLPNPARSPRRSKGGQSSRASSMSSVDKHDEMVKNVACSPDSCGDTNSHTVIHSLSVVNLEDQAVCEPSTCQPDLYSGNVIGSSTVEAASEEGGGANDVGMVLSGSLPANGGIQKERNQSQVDEESELGEGNFQGVDAPRLDRAVAIEAASDSGQASSQRQGMEEKPLSSSPEHGPKAIMAQQEGLIGSASGINACCKAESAEDESGSSKEGCMSKQLTNNCMLASSVEGCQTSLDRVAPYPEGHCEGVIKIPSGTQGPSERVDAESRLYTSGYDEDYALAVARQVAIEVEQEVHGKLNADSSSPCASETDSSSNACTKASKQEVNLTGTKHLDSGLQNGDDVNEDHDSSHVLHRLSQNEAIVCNSAPPHVIEMEMGNYDSVTGDDCYTRPLFDLNEGLSTEEEQVFQSVTEPTVTVVDTHIVTFPSSIAVPVAVVTATRGPFIPPSDLLRSRGGLGGGWKGAAATSAFRPAEPRQYLSESGQSHSDAGRKRARMLDIDLNVADERGSESVDMVTSSRMDLDLNKTGEVEESAGLLCSSPCKVSASSPHILRDFDLNDGIDIEGSLEQDLPRSISVGCPLLPQYCINPMAMLVSSTNGTEPSLPTEVRPTLESSIQSLVTADVFRSDASLSSNVPFMANVPNGLPYSGFPFISGFPAALSSSCMLTSSVVTTPFAAGPVPLAGGSSYKKPYVLGSELDTRNAVSYRARPGLDLNAGPAGDPDARDDGANGFLTSAQGEPINRKEPEPYFDPFRSGFRQLV